MLAQVFMITSAGIIEVLGVLHLIFTFFGARLRPRDPALQTAMNQVAPVISGETTMWRAWMGFNASHSMGAMLFGLIYSYLALTQAALLFNSPFLLLVGLAMLGGLAALGRAYWFSVPFRGIGLALACYVLAVAASLA